MNMNPSSRPNVVGGSCAQLGAPRCRMSPGERVGTILRVLTSDPAAPIVLLSPHLDDAVWACFSLLGRDTVVSTAFAGIPRGEPGWWDATCGITDSAANVRARRA